MKQLIAGILLMLVCLTAWIMLSGCDQPKVTYSNWAVIDVDISEIVDPEWFDYSYFWQAGKDENGHDLTFVTIYWTKPIYDALYDKWDTYEGVTTYVTDGKTWEIVK